MIIERSKLRFLKLIIAVTLLFTGFGCIDQFDVKDQKTDEYWIRAKDYIQREKYHAALTELQHILTVDPKNDKVYYQLGAIYSLLKRRDKALEMFSKAANLNPYNLKAQLNLAQTMLLIKNIKEARVRVEWVLQKAPDNSNALKTLAKIQSQEGNYLAAIETLEKVVYLYPGESDSHLSLSRLYLIRGDLDKSDRAYQKAASIDHSLMKYIVRLSDTEYQSIPAIAFDYEKRGRFIKAEKVYQTVVDSTEGKNKVAFLKAMAAFYARQKSYEKALSALKSAYLVRDELDILILIAHLHLDFDKIEAAETAVNQILDYYPGQMDANFLKGRIYYTLKDYEAAFESFEKIIGDSPKYAKAYYYRALSLLAQGRVKRARDSLQDAVDINPHLIEAHVKLAWYYLEYFEKGNMSLARKHLEMVLAQVPNHKKGLTLFGQLKMKEGDLEAAEIAYRRLVQTDPGNLIGYYQLGIIHYLNDRREEALQSFEQIVALHPLHKGALTYAITIHLENGKPEKALNFCERSDRIAGDNTELKAVLENLRGRIFLVKNDFNAAQNHFKRSIEFDPNIISSHIALAKLYLRNNNSDAVISHFQEQIKKDPLFLLGYMMLGIVYDERQNPQMAESYYRQALTINRDFIPAANNLAWNLAERDKNINEALNLARNIKYIVPENPHVLDTLGWIYYKLGYYGKAVMNLEKSVSILPDNPLYNYRLGKAYYQNEQLKEAKVYMKKALTLAPNFKGAEDARLTLKRYRSLEG